MSADLADLKAKRIKEEIKLLKKKQELVDLEMLAEENRHKPHNREFTKTFQAPDDSGWICTSMHADKGDTVGVYPTGFGSTPEEAQQDFNRAWYSNR